MKIGCNCGRQWTGLSQAHCMSCHCHFGSVSAFDRHRVGGAGCQDPANVVDKAGRQFYKRAEGPFGTTWVRDRPGEHYRTTPKGDAA